MSRHVVAPGRLPGAPVAIIDIGSNSVRLVCYEALSRALTPIFNEKVLCGLGRGVATTGLLSEDAMDRAVAALSTFRLLCRQMGVVDITTVATAATRDASNGQAFLARAREAIGTEITLVGGTREAELSALGVMSGVFRPDGLVGDLGGGSLELIDIAEGSLGAGVSLPIGGLALSDLSGQSSKRAVRIVRDALAGTPLLAGLKGRMFHAVGGTWRALAKVHMVRRNYPLHVAQGYLLPPEPALFHELAERAERDTGGALADAAGARRSLLPFGAVVLEEIIRVGQPAGIAISTLGVREGLLFERLRPEQRRADPLLEAARELNHLRARDPRHADDLCQWTDRLFASLALPETDEERRLRYAACLLSDIAWRAHPDYRGAQAFTTVANAAFVAIDHPGRCFLALTINFRHEGVDADSGSELHSLLSPASLERARLVAGAFRIAFQLSAAMGGVLPDMPLEAVPPGTVTLRMPAADQPLASARVMARLKQFARLVGREPALVMEG